MGVSAPEQRIKHTSQFYKNRTESGQIENWIFVKRISGKEARKRAKNGMSIKASVARTRGLRRTCDATLLSLATLMPTLKFQASIPHTHTHTETHTLLSLDSLSLFRHNRTNLWGKRRFLAVHRPRFAATDTCISGKFLRHRPDRLEVRLGVL